MKYFVLKEFSNQCADLFVEAKVSMTADHITTDFRVSGDLKHLVFGEMTPRPSFRLNLWQSTCFELFLGRKHSSLYSEWNMAPSGDWAYFDFLGYRKIAIHGRSESETTSYAARHAPTLLRRDFDQRVLGFQMNVNAAAWKATTEFEVRDCLIHPTCILQFDDQGEKQLTYWAPQHGSKLDFHDQKAWTIFGWNEILDS